MTTRRNAQGTTSVEFALIALVFFTVLFALIDFSRLFWHFASLDEVTRRGARVAAVCPINDPNIVDVALFGGLVPGLAAQNISIRYLDIDSNTVDPTTPVGYGSIRYVRVSIQDFQLQTFIPGFQALIPMPAFETTIPSESLGRVGTTDVPC